MGSRRPLRRRWVCASRPGEVLRLVSLRGDDGGQERGLRDPAGPSTRAAQEWSSGPDEPLDVNLDRSHLSVAMRNFLGLLVNPFFPTQGALWTGVHVVVAERWKKGPKEMPSIFDGLGSYYLMGIPFLYVTLPFITLMKPLMQMALTLTLILTGFACAYVAMAIPKKNSEMASALLIAVFITFFSAWIGLIIGILLSLFVVGTDKDKV